MQNRAIDESNNKNGQLWPTEIIGPMLDSLEKNDRSRK